MYIFFYFHLPPSRSSRESSKFVRFFFFIYLFIFILSDVSSHKYALLYTLLARRVLAHCRRYFKRSIGYSDKTHFIAIKPRRVRESVDEKCNQTIIISARPTTRARCTAAPLHRINTITHYVFRVEENGSSHTSWLVKTTTVYVNDIIILIIIIIFYYNTQSPDDHYTYQKRQST
jgi:hypothetical protein